MSVLDIISNNEKEKLHNITLFGNINILVLGMLLFQEKIWKGRSGGREDFEIFFAIANVKMIFKFDQKMTNCNLKVSKQSQLPRLWGD